MITTTNQFSWLRLDTVKNFITMLLAKLFLGRLNGYRHLSEFYDLI